MTRRAVLVLLLALLAACGTSEIPTPTPAPDAPPLTRAVGPDARARAASGAPVVVLD